MIQSLQADAPIQHLCEVFDCPRSTYYYHSIKRDEADLVAAIEQVLMRRPWFGYRRVMAQLRREGVVVGETVIRRILRQLQHSRSVGQVRVQTTDSNHPYTRYTNLIRGVKPKQPTQIWVADITYIRLGTRFLYLAVILDAFSRAVRGWALSRSLSQDLTLDALKMALKKGTPLIFHSDQGSQYSAWLHTDMLDSAGARVSMSDRGQPTQNGIAERFMRTLKDEHIDYADYADFQDAHRQIAYWLEVEYNTQRIHSALHYATPAEFEMSVHTRTAPS
jgi:putative transposase